MSVPPSMLGQLLAGAQQGGGAGAPLSPAAPPVAPQPQQQPFSPAPAPVQAAPPTPPSTPPKKKPGGSFEEAVAREYDRQLHLVASGAARELGAPPDSVTLSKDDEQSRWEYRSPDITPEQLPTIADTVLVGILQKYQQGNQPMPDPETLTRMVAAQVNRVLTKGMRREMVSRGAPDPASQVSKAQGYARRYGPKPDTAAPQQPAPAPATQEGGY